MRSSKDLLFNTKHAKSLQLSSFDISIKVAFGLGPILGESFTFSIPFPPLPTELINSEPPKVSKNIPYAHIPIPPPLFASFPKSVENRLTSLEKQVRKFRFDQKSPFSNKMISLRDFLGLSNGFLKRKTFLDS